MARDRRLLGAMLSFVASALAGIIQAGIVRAYIYAAVMDNWTAFSRFFGVAPPARPGAVCLDYCVAELPFAAGWLGIIFFALGFGLLLHTWLRPA